MLNLIYDDAYFMKQALQEAEKAYSDNEVPIGAVVTFQNHIIGKGYNQVERLKDSTAHAEIIAITAACNYIGAKYLEDCSIYVTVEPCVMCAGAIKWARINKLVYGIGEPKTGFSNFIDNDFFKKIDVHGDIEALEAKKLMQDFFMKKRGLHN